MLKSEQPQSSGVYAVIQELIPHETVKIANDPITDASISHIIPCHPPTASRLAIIAAKSIIEKVVYMSFGDITDCVFVAVFPNTIECD